MFFNKPQSVVTDGPAKLGGLKTSRIYRWYRHRDCDLLLSDSTDSGVGYNARSGFKHAVLHAVTCGGLFRPSNWLGFQGGDTAIHGDTVHDVLQVLRSRQVQ